MSPDQLRDLLQHAPTARRLVLNPAATASTAGVAALPSPAELFALWLRARAEANLAYAAWCRTKGSEAYAVYRAAEDRADAAQSILAARVRKV